MNFCKNDCIESGIWEYPVAGPFKYLSILNYVLAISSCWIFSIRSMLWEYRRRFARFEVHASTFSILSIYISNFVRQTPRIPKIQPSFPKRPHSTKKQFKNRMNEIFCLICVHLWMKRTRFWQFLWCFHDFSLKWASIMRSWGFRTWEFSLWI